MRVNEKELDRLLALVADHIDLEHCREVDERYRNALAYQEVDRPPLVVQAPFGAVLNLPDPWDTFHRYSYRETFDGPVAMLQNILLDRVVPGLLLKDDNPLAIRNNHGTIQIASVLGGSWRIYEDNYPWVEHFTSIEPIEEIACSTEEIDLQGGLLPRSFETLRFYRAKLDEYPPCKEAIQVSLPDLEGPLNAASQLWGSNIYYAFADHAELLDRLLARIVDIMLVLSERFRKYATDRLDPVANTQHGYVIPGRLLNRIDAAIVLSPSTYAEFIRPHDARLLREVGTGSIHLCGNGQHLVAGMLDIPALRGLDFGEPHLVDIAVICAVCHDRNVAVTDLKPSRDDLVSGKARRDFPTGVVFIYQTENFEDAREVVRNYQSI